MVSGGNLMTIKGKMVFFVNFNHYGSVIITQILYQLTNSIRYQVSVYLS